jgi:hypothetical protein
MMKLFEIYPRMINIQLPERAKYKLLDSAPSLFSEDVALHAEA